MVGIIRLREVLDQKSFKARLLGGNMFRTLYSITDSWVFPVIIEGFLSLEK